ncbi:MAG: alpha/beta fold hydrolase [Betaproteobacteria bacterium]|nr:alpha/beta fold hydrolase [Betaproteobacteria bacterium]
MSRHFLDIDPGLRMCYRVADYTDPWRKPETVVCVHGFGESGEAWFGWVPHLARQYKVIRIDQRGFGDSTPMPDDFPWSLDVLVNDLGQAVRALGGGPVHLIAAKIAGPVIMRFAATHPRLTRSITVVGSMSRGPEGVKEWLQHIERQGVESWARTTMPPRLGSDMLPEAVDWWVKLTSRTPASTARGLFRVVSQIDVTADLPNIHCPALIITTDSRRRPVAKTQEWQSLIPHSTLVALHGDAYHPAASDPDRCAAATLEFLARLPRA